MGPINATGPIALTEGNSGLLAGVPWTEAGSIATKYYKKGAKGTHDTVAFHGVYDVPASNTNKTRYLANVQCQVIPTERGGQDQNGETRSSVREEEAPAEAIWGVASPRRVSVELLGTDEVDSAVWVDTSTEPDFKEDHQDDYEGRIGFGADWTALPNPMKLDFTTSKPITSVLILADLMQQDACHDGPHPNDGGDGKRICPTRLPSATGYSAVFRVIVDGQEVAMSEGGSEVTVAIRGVALQVSAGNHTAEVQYRTRAGYGVMFPLIGRLGAERASRRRLTVLQGDYDYCLGVQAWTLTNLRYKLESGATHHTHLPPLFRALIH